MGSQKDRGEGFPSDSSSGKSSRQAKVLRRGQRPPAEIETIPAGSPGSESFEQRGVYPQSDSLVGQRIGHVRVEAILGRGGMGEVFRGFDETLERPVAIKKIHADFNEIVDLSDGGVVEL